VFEALVKEGMNLQKKVKRLTDTQVEEVSQEISGRINEAAQKAAGAWDRLEAVFEERVGRAINRLGVPSKADITALIARVEALTQQVANMNAKPSRGGTTQAKANGAAAVKDAKRIMARATQTTAKKVKSAANVASN
jgi:Poly(hydroxyalcanoate) granule associated protein (phasin).